MNKNQSDDKDQNPEHPKMGAKHEETSNKGINEDKITLNGKNEGATKRPGDSGDDESVKENNKSQNPDPESDETDKFSDQDELSVEVAEGEDDDGDGVIKEGSESSF
ncbi:MAG: hypothetical protein ABIO46_07700 [Chitinophagales bacterium]